MSKPQLKVVSDRRISVPITLVKELDPTQLAVYCRLLAEASPNMQVKLNTVEMSDDIGISQVKLKEVLSQLCRLNYFVKGSLITLHDIGMGSVRIVQLNEVEVEE